MRFAPRDVVLLVAVLCLAVLQPRAQTAPGAPGSFSLAEDRQPLVSLNGQWRFQPGDDPRWASSSFDDSHWPLLRSDQPWTSQGYKDLGGFAWYRFTVRNASPAIPLSLLLPAILTDYEVFADGQKIGGFGRMPPHDSLQFGQMLLYALPPTPAGSTVHIAIRVWHHPIFASYLGGGIRYGGGLVGDTSLLQEHFRMYEADRSVLAVDIYVLGVFDGLIGFVVLGLFLAHRSEREYLWFAIVLLSGALSSVVLIGDFLLHFPLNWRDFATEALGSVETIAALLFFSRVLHARATWWWRVVLLLAALDPLTLCLQAFGLTSVAATTSLRVLLDVPIELWILALLIRRSRERSSDARLLLGPTLLLYGNQVINGLLLCSYQLGWQRRVASTSQWNPIRKPFSFETYALLELVFVVALLVFLIRRFAQSRASEQRHQADLEAVRVLQQVLIPESVATMPGIHIETAYHPAQEVGGDFFQILPITNLSDTEAAPETCIVLGDVAGKGLPAAMTVSLVVGATRALADVTPSPAALLTQLNRRVGGLRSGFTTCLALRISASGELRIANAGHLAPYLNGIELTLEAALPLGIDESAAFPETTIQLMPGDRLTLLTDGIPEATCNRELFGFERTAAISKNSAGVIAQTAEQFGQADDITVITVDVADTPVPGEFPSPIPQ